MKKGGKSRKSLLGDGKPEYMIPEHINLKGKEVGGCDKGLLFKEGSLGIKGMAKPQTGKRVKKKGLQERQGCKLVSCWP